MTLLGIQQRLREIGRIRIGEQVTRGGKTFPTSLDTFRLTSGDSTVLEAAAQRYGGTVTPWESGYELTTATDRLPVMLPPGRTAEPFSLAYELWAKGGCQRRCDGTTATIPSGEGFSEVDCLCDAERRECKPTLRVSFLLPELPGIGTWRLQTTGYYAASEMPGTLNLLRLYSDQGRPLKAVLLIDKRTSKSGGTTKHYVVPVLDLPQTLSTLTALPDTQLPIRELPLLPNELESDGGAPPEAPEPESVPDEGPAPDHAPALPEEEKEASLPPPSPTAGYRREELVEVARSKGIGIEGIERYAALVGIQKGATATLDQMDRLIEMVAGHGTDEPLDLNLEPPRPRTDAYRALSPVQKANARAYWQDREGNEGEP